MLDISRENAFAQGGNRLCFINPQRADRCIKVRRPDFSLKDLRRKKGYPKRLLPLHFFDDNREEYRVIRALENKHGPQVFELISHCYGFTETDLGPGLELELIRDVDGRISQTLKAEIWFNGYSSDCQQAVKRFCMQWRRLQLPSRDLLLHNLLVQKNNEGCIKRIVVIDGLGSPNIIPFDLLPNNQRAAKVNRKLSNLNERIERLLDKKRQGAHPGNHGMATAHQKF